MKDLLRHLGSRIAELRMGDNLSRRIVAEGAGVSERFLAMVEAGRANISVVKLDAIARQLCTTPAALLTGSGARVRAHERLRLLLEGRSGEELDELENWLASRETASRSRRIIALLGLRGAGKTSQGRALAERLGRPFVELDQLVETRAGLSLAEIFALHGEAYYRRLAREALGELLGKSSGAVVATGGGLVNDPETFDLLRARAVTVWLKARPEDHWRRVVAQGDRRPMKGNPRARRELVAILAERTPLYARAQHVVDTSALGFEGSVRELVRIAGVKGAEAAVR